MNNKSSELLFKNLYDSLFSKNITAVVDESATKGSKNYNEFVNFCRNQKLNSEITFNLTTRIISVPNKGKIYFINTGSYERILGQRIDNYIYNGTDERVISFLNSRLV